MSDAVKDIYENTLSCSYPYPPRTPTQCGLFYAVATENTLDAPTYKYMLMTFPSDIQLLAECGRGNAA